MSSLLSWVAEALWPRRCIRCGASGVELCAGCRSSLVRAPLTRVVRGITIYSAGTMTDEPLARGIWNLKYRNLPGLADPLAAWAADTIKSPPRGILVPVPLHANRRHERGYNQAELLAQAYGRILSLPIAADALVRVRDTGSQVERATRAERLENMSRAFEARDPESIEGQDVILVDDVSTTGATLQACAVALHESGARSISAIVLARG